MVDIMINNKHSREKNSLQSGVISMGLVMTMISLLLLSGYLFWRWNTQAELIQVNASLPKHFPENSFSHQSFAQLLTRFVNNHGNVDYELWSQESSAIIALDQYLAAVAKYSPENAPQRFEHKNDRLAYWVYAYNAQVIKSILSNWPLSSVTDLKAPVEMIQGLGFFYKRKFIFGGKVYSLYQVENSKIFDGQSDPRVHFILNCGSYACPVLRPQLPIGEALEPFLQQSAIDFIHDIKNVRLDHVNKILFLSTIFKWNKSDFVEAIESNQQAPSLIGYLQSISGEPLYSQLELAKDYEIVFIEYDWSVNQVKESAAQQKLEKNLDQKSVKDSY